MAFQRANHYEVAGDGIDATVDLSSFSGQPIASVTLDRAQLENASVSDERDGVSVTALVSVTDDGPTTSLRLVLPHVNLALDDGEYEATVAGYAVVTTVLNSIGGPGLVRGALELYDVRGVEGTASIVEA